jgi:hypothetical protein
VPEQIVSPGATLMDTDGTTEPATVNTTLFEVVDALVTQLKLLVITTQTESLLLREPLV